MGDTKRLERITLMLTCGLLTGIDLEGRRGTEESASSTSPEFVASCLSIASDMLQKHPLEWWVEMVKPKPALDPAIYTHAIGSIFCMDCEPRWLFSSGGVGHRNTWLNAMIKCRSGDHLCGTACAYAEGPSSELKVGQHYGEDSEWDRVLKDARQKKDTKRLERITLMLTCGLLTGIDLEGRRGTEESASSTSPEFVASCLSIASDMLQKHPLEWWMEMVKPKPAFFSINCEMGSLFCINCEPGWVFAAGAADHRNSFLNAVMKCRSGNHLYSS